jgi:glycosyltransferase involved in cell wall biosynthesis
MLGIREPVYFVTLPTAWDVVARLPRRALVYNRSDKHSAFPEADQAAIRQVEQQLLRRADRVVYTSHALMAAEAGVAGDRAVFIDHGVDLDRFAEGAVSGEPDDLAAIPRPRVGFIGGLDDYVVDLELLEATAREVPHAHIVLVGAATGPINRLTARENVHWLGQRPLEEVPAYGRGLDVALMPWLENEWSYYCNPIKLKEYLALGLPIVSTWFPEVEQYSPWIRIAHTHEEFVSLVKLTLADGGLATARSRREVVRDSTWAARAVELAAACEAPATVSRSTGVDAAPARGESPRRRSVA